MTPARLIVRASTLTHICYLCICVLCFDRCSQFPVHLPAHRQVLYIADDNEIRSLDPSVPNWRYEQIFQGDANVRIDAMDLHVKTNRIYWTNWHTGRISSYDLPSTSSSANSNRNRRQSDSRVTNLEVNVYSGSLLSYIKTLFGRFLVQFVGLCVQDPRSEDAPRHCCGLGGRKPVLD